MSDVTTTVTTAPLNFSVVLEVLDDVGHVLGELDGVAAERTAAQEAELNRTLSNAADRLALASSLVRNEYWNQRGLPSYEL